MGKRGGRQPNPYSPRSSEPRTNQHLEHDSTFLLGYPPSPPLIHPRHAQHSYQHTPFILLQPLHSRHHHPPPFPLLPRSIPRQDASREMTCARDDAHVCAAATLLMRIPPYSLFLPRNGTRDAMAGRNETTRPHYR